jgi:hypothetical protein
LKLKFGLALLDGNQQKYINRGKQKIAKKKKKEFWKMEPAAGGGI